MPPSVVLDASVVIAHLNQGDVHAERAFTILDTEDEFALHPVTLAECLVFPARSGRTAEALATLARIGVETLVPDPAEPALVAELRAGNRVALPDCFVLGAAIRHGAALGTFDERLATAAKERGVTVVDGGGRRPAATEALPPI